MKNKIIILIALMLASGQFAVAIEDPSNAVKKETNQKIMQDFDQVNQYSNNFFTPYKKIQVSESSQVESMSLNTPSDRGTMAPVKRLRMWLKYRNEPKKEIIEDKGPKNQAILDCDTMEYFADRTELEANGNVYMVFPQNNSSIRADKLVYNQTSNLIKAFGEVVMVKDGQKLYGDFMQVDMNEENAFMDNPTTDLFQIHVKSKKGYMYGDKIIQEQGSMYVSKKTPVNLRAEMFGPDLDSMYVNDVDKSAIKKDAHGELFKIKTNDLIINAKKEHDTVTLKHAEFYYKEKKIATIPSITVHTNKAQDYVEADFPEFGTTTNLGMYAGPGFVFDTIKGSTLKVVPILNYRTNSSENDSSFGLGGIAKFKSATNKTDIAYGSASKMLIVRGKQRLDDNLYFQYGANSYQDDWFLGYRMPKYMGELVYDNAYLSRNFLSKDLDLNFRHRIAAGYMQDFGVDGVTDSIDSEGGIGTTRFKYMAEAAQTLYRYDDPENLKSLRFEMAFQGAASIYGTGDTQMIARVGPRLHTQYKYWMQDIGYFLSAYDDHTPMVRYDRYVYGRSNVYVRETLRLHKYVTLSWVGSLNLSNDSWNDALMQENLFFVALGPDDIKLHIGYDTVREQSFVALALNLDAKGTTLEYKKMVIKNPERLGKSDKADENKSFVPVSDTVDESMPERAEVTNLESITDVK